MGQASNLINSFNNINRNAQYIEIFIEIINIVKKFGDSEATLKDKFITNLAKLSSNCAWHTVITYHLQELSVLKNQYQQLCDKARFHDLKDINDHCKFIVLANSLQAKKKFIEKFIRSFLDSKQGKELFYKVLIKLKDTSLFFTVMILEHFVDLQLEIGNANINKILQFKKCIGNKYFSQIKSPIVAVNQTIIQLQNYFDKHFYKDLKTLYEKRKKLEDYLFDNKRLLKTNSKRYLDYFNKLQSIVKKGIAKGIGDAWKQGSNLSFFQFMKTHIDMQVSVKDMGDRDSQIIDITIETSERNNELFQSHTSLLNLLNAIANDVRKSICWYNSNTSDQAIFLQNFFEQINASDDYMMVILTDKCTFNDAFENRNNKDDLAFFQPGEGFDNMIAAKNWIDQFEKDARELENDIKACEKNSLSESNIKNVIDLAYKQQEMSEVIASLINQHKQSQIYPSKHHTNTIKCDKSKESLKLMLKEQSNRLTKKLSFRLYKEPSANSINLPTKRANINGLRNRGSYGVIERFKMFFENPVLTIKIRNAFVDCLNALSENNEKGISVIGDLKTNLDTLYRDSMFHRKGKAYQAVDDWIKKNKDVISTSSNSSLIN